MGKSKCLYRFVQHITYFEDVWKHSHSPHKSWSVATAGEGLHNGLNKADLYELFE